MTDILAGVGSSTSAATNQSSATLAQNFDTFLTLLTQQLQNQDPLNPLDSTEFVNQLVNFSSVEQLISQNSSLDRIIALQTASAAGSSVAYIGREALVLGDTATLQDDRAVWTYSPTGAAASTQIVVRNEDGEIVFETDGETAASQHEFVWDGLDAAGQPAPPGVYSLEVKAFDADDAAISVAIAGYGRVSGVDLSTSEPFLMFGDARAPLSQVIALREPQT